MNDRSDADLLANYVRTRSQDAFAALVRRYARLVYQSASRQSRDPATAEDVTQAVFIVLARRAGEIRHAQTLAAWLLKTTFYAAKNARLAETRRRIHEQAAAMNASHVESAEQLEPDVGPMLDAALLRLGDKDRSLVALHYFQGQTLGEIAAVAGMTSDAVRKRISRAIDRLRGMLSSNGSMLSSAAFVELLHAAARQPLPGHLFDAILNGAASSHALAISKGAHTMMKIGQIKYIAATIGGVGLTAAATVAIAAAVAGSPPARQAVSPAKSPAPATGPTIVATTTTAPVAPDVMIEGARRLRDLTMAAQMYSYDHKGQYPPDLGTMWDYINTGQRRPRVDGNLAKFYFVPDDPKLQALPPKLTTQWLSENTSFVYLVANLNNSINNRANPAVMHLKLDAAHDGKILVAFADGHVETMEEAKAQAVIEESKTLLDTFR